MAVLIDSATKDLPYSCRCIAGVAGRRASMVKAITGPRGNCLRLPTERPQVSQRFQSRSIKNGRAEMHLFQRREAPY